MRYKDRVYGVEYITEDVVLDIIYTSTFERLKGIDQAGYFEVYFPGTTHSRFEHSLGCYLLLKKYNASLEEQIAGLIHDISHTAFSHVSDYVFKEGDGARHNYQDDIFESFVQKTKIPQILEKHGYDTEYILDEANFSLQETQLPDLCADRIDYSIRGALVYGIATQEQIKQLLENLKVIDNKWVFKSVESALKYARLFKILNDVYYSNKETAAMFLRTSRWIKYAVDKKYIKYDDLFAKDKEVIEQININIESDEILKQLWKEMNNPHIELCDGSYDDCQEVVVKSRVVDPLIKKEFGDIVRLSQIDLEWRKILEQDKEPKKYFVK
jgi:HD superfamily phosphohydrolase